jgi:hypothetical protein
MRIPLNVSGAKSKLKSVFSGGKLPEKTGEQQPTRRTQSEIAKEREKRRALTDELANANTTAQRKQEIIDGLQAQLDTVQAERDELNSKLEELSPSAKAWNNYQHKERSKLIASFPPEEQKDAKAIADGMDLETFRKYAQKVTGIGASAGSDAGKGGQQGQGGKKDWEKILAGEDADKETANDQAGFNEFMDSRGK